MPEDRFGDIQTIEAVLSFDDFFRAEYRKTISLAYAVSGNRAAAEDIAQEAMLEAASLVGSDRSVREAGRRLRRVTIQKASRRVPARALGVDGNGQSSALASHFPRVQTRSRGSSRRCARSPPGNGRLSPSTISTDTRSPTPPLALGCAQGTVKAHLHKGRRALARMLGEGSVE